MASKVVNLERVGLVSVGEALDEAELVLRSRKGETAAFGSLVGLYQDRLFNVCLRMMGDRGVAEDLVQEAFVKAYRSLGAFDGRAAFYTWLYRIAVNLCLSERRKPRRPTVSLNSGRSYEREPVQQPSRDAGPVEAAAEREAHGMVLAALEELDDEHRAVVVLRDIESLDYGEIADILGVPAGTVKSRLHRARLALRERLRPMLGE